MRFACLCCGFLTLSEVPPGTYAICPVCYWEDDYAQGVDPTLSGGANVPSLRSARAAFAEYGAVEHRFVEQVRTPLPEEYPDLQSSDLRDGQPDSP